MSFDYVRFGSLFTSPQKNGLTRPKKVRGAGLPMVNMGELFAHPRIKDLPMDRVPVSVAERSFVLEPGDLLFARQSLVLEGAGQCSIFLGGSEPTVFESHLIRCRLDRCATNAEFYFYFFQSPEGRRAIEAIAEQGAGASGIRGSDLVNVLVPHPPRSWQDAAALVLATVDNRIALLRETNATLEAVAQALFKSWFVDFDPVRAKQQGIAPAGMEDGVAALFADRFVESALGPVPEGWRVGSLGDVARTVKSQLQPSELRADINYVGFEHIARRSLSLSAWGNAEGLESAKAKFSAGDVLFGKLRPYFHKVAVAPFDGVCSTDILVCQSKLRAYYGFAAMHLFSTALVDYSTRLSNGAKMPRIGWSDVAAYAIVVPPEQIASAYTRLVAPMFEQMTLNVFRSHTLATLRDTLLPRLISGQLRIPEAEAEVAEAIA